MSWYTKMISTSVLLSFFFCFQQAAASNTSQIVIKFVPDITEQTVQDVANHINEHPAILNSFRERTHIALMSVEAEHLKSTLQALNADERVEYAHADVRFSTDAQTVPWGVDDNGVNADTLHTDGIRGEGVVVAIVDSGADLDHPDLAANLWSPAHDDCTVYGDLVSGACPNGGYDFANDDATPQDDNEHGTHVAGIVGALDNDVGIVGVAPEAQLMIVKVLDSSGYGSYTTIVEGIQFAIDNGADIINLSLGSMYDDLVPQELLDVITEAEHSGVLVVAATGNDASHVPYLPSQFSSVLSVGAIQETDTQDNPEDSYNTRLAFFSNWGKVDVVAPGVRINSTIPNNTYSGDSWEGTSMATPMVSGVAALLLSQDPTLTPAELRFIIESTATDLGETGKDDFFGAGLVNANAALAALESNAETLLVEPTWSENSFDDLGSGLYDVTTIYTGRLAAHTDTTSTLRVQLREASGAPIADTQLSVSLSLGTVTSPLPITTDNNGFAYIDIVAPADAGRATLTVTHNATSSETALIFADTLFVHDAGQPESTDIDGWIYQRALEENGVLWTESTEDTPGDITNLSNFDTVVWDTGSYGLNINEQAALIEFLSSERNLILFGGNMLSTHAYYAEHTGSSTHAIDELFSTYLGVSFVSSAPQSLELIGTGVLGTTHYNGIIDASDSYAQSYSDGIAARTGSSVLAYYCDNTEDAIVEHSNGYHTITSGIGLELYAHTDRTEILGRLLNVLSGTSNNNETISHTCDMVDNSATQDAHAQSDQTEAPDVLNSEIDSLQNVQLSINDTSATLSWDNDEQYTGSSALAIDLITFASIAATGTSSSVTLEGLDSSARYVVVVSVESNTEIINPYYASITTEVQTPSDIALTKTRRKSLTIETTQPGANETLTIQVALSDHTVVRTISSTTGVNTLSDLSQRSEYAIRARIVGQYNTSDWTPWLAAKTASNRVHKPTVEVLSAHSVKVFWEKPTHSAVRSYRAQIFKKRNDGSYILVEQKKISKHMKRKNRSTIFEHLPSGHSYRVRVRATFENGDVGVYSRVRTIKASRFNQ